MTTLPADVRPAKITHTDAMSVIDQSAAATWDSAVAAYRAAKANDDAYTAAHIDPPLRGLPPGPIMSAATDTIPACVWAEAQRLCEELTHAEDTLMDLPSPHAFGFAMKYLVAHGDGRETDCWNTMLAAEAIRFAKEA
ncbi:hypothetical protein NF700_06880 [Sphingomonadaceae bacterium OTU29MARTA1]|nr:hypothetical protein NF700_06880 [Sphingomonadaceae bacterium OTU29MARTA1]